MQSSPALSAGRAHRRISRPLIAAGLTAAVLTGLAIGFVAHLLLSPGASARLAPARTAAGLRGDATWASGVRPAPHITTLRDQSGRLFSLSSLRGHTVVMEFFDSHCRQECPLAGRALAAAERALPAAQRPVLVVVSVNPLDTPASARAAAREWGLAGVAPWHWLMGSHAQLAPVWRRYRIYVHPERGDISHTEALYLIDRRGDERSGYLYPYMPGSVTHDLRVLASAAGAGSRGHA
jgi:cytochrome oxidase Cu insertion factor (SCO1/SenC/PrrC family)